MNIKAIMFNAGMGVKNIEINNDEYTIKVYTPKDARALAHQLEQLADKLEANNANHPTVIITKPKRRTKSGQVRAYLICKKCKHVVFNDYTPYSLSTALRIGKCKCGPFCLNNEWERKRFKEVTYKEAMEQKRVNKAKPKAGRD